MDIFRQYVQFDSKRQWGENTVMNDRDRNIAEAAQCLFARYGVGKTTMNDIAREAGIARQTLYNAFPNKNEVLRASVRISIAQTSNVIKAAWENEVSFDGKLDQFFINGPLCWYDMVASTPDVSELVDGIHSVAADEMKQAGDDWVVVIADLIKTHSSYQGDALALAEFIYSTAMNAKLGVEDRNRLVMRLDVLKQSIMALLGDSLHAN